LAFAAILAKFVPAELFRIKRGGVPLAGRTPGCVPEGTDLHCFDNGCTGLGMAKPLTPEEIKVALQKLPGWTLEGNALAKSFKFGSFREAMSFMVRTAFEAEAMDHHPDWTNVYNRVAVRLNTHDAGGKVTAKDVELAGKIQAISWVG
jgi:4a-hydroxytetrahydrobiopterin dehydratase